MLEIAIIALAISIGVIIWCAILKNVRCVEQHAHLPWPSAFAIGSAVSFSCILFTSAFIYISTLNQFEQMFGFVLVIYLLGIFSVPAGLYQLMLKIPYSKALLLAFLQNLFYFFFGAWVFISLYFLLSIFD